MDFSKPPGYNPLRPLKLTRPATVGYDVHALQTLLLALDGAPGTLDGICGPKTDQAILYVQADLGLEQDGKVGPKTWEAGVGVLSEGFRQQFGLPKGLPFGQLKHESSLYGGNYSRPMRADKTYDAGVAMRNTQFTHPSEGFNVPKSIGACAEVERRFYDLFVGVTPNRRRWTLAAGSWNAWAYACWYARREGASRVTKGMTAEPGPKATKAFEKYMADATAFLVT